MGDWTESKYTETRFGGMDHAVEPHTLDRDGGFMSDEFNMVSRTQGLRNRMGWRPQNDLTLYVSSLPGTPKSPIALIPYDANITTVAEDDDDDDSGGDGGNGGVIGGLVDGGDDDVTPGGGGSGVSLTLTGPLAVVAEVPFTIAAQASGLYRGTNAHLDWGFQPDGTPSVSMSKGIRSGWDDNEWAASATVLTTDRSKTGVTATLKKVNAVQMTKNMGYSVASMIPSLSSPVPYRQNFQLTISCKLGGATQTGYAGNGRGVAVSWQAFDENNQSVSCHVRHSQVSWSNGVGTYNAYLSSVASTATKLKVTVTYAGESKTAEATISGVGLLRVPSALHVFGGGGTMRINAVGLDKSVLTIVASVDGETVDLSDYLQMNDGTDIDFTQGWDENNVWEHGIAAKTSAPAATLTLKLMNGQTEMASDTITIADGLAATISASPSPLYPGDSLTASASITATGHVITRFPENVVELQILAVEDDVFVDNAEGETELSASYDNVPDGTLTVQVLDMRPAEPLVLASLTIETSSYQTKLVQAINERLIAKGYTDNDLLDEDETDKWSLYTYGNLAMKDFVDGSVQNNGTCTFFGNSEMPAYADTDDEWYQDAYEKVIKAVTMQCSPTVSGTIKGSRYRGNMDSYVYGSGTQADPYVLEDKDVFKARVAAEGYNPSLDDEDCANAYDSYLHAMKGGTFEEGFVSGNMYALHHASLSLSYQCKKYTLTPKVSGTVDMYFASANKASTYETFSHAAPSAASTTAKCGTFQATANQASESQWFGGNGSSLSAETRQIGTTIGYCMTLYRAYIHYNFQHK